MYDENNITLEELFGCPIDDDFWRKVLESFADDYDFGDE